MQDCNENLVTLMISLSSLIISIIALIYTIRAFWLKKGDKYRIPHASFPCTSIESSNSYVSSLTIENLKDKPLIVFGIYLKFGNNVFLEIEKFDEKPYIIPAFEAHQFNYGKVIYYSLGIRKVNIQKLFDSQKIKPQFIVETVNTRGFLIRRFFKNFATAMISPVRLLIDEKSFGDNIDFIINLDDKKELIPVYQGEYSWGNRIKIPEKYLRNKETIEKFMYQLQDEGKINFSKIEIIDWKNEIDTRFELKKLKNKEQKISNTAGYIEYFIVGKIYTITQNIKTKIINSSLYKRYKKIKLKILKNKK